MEPERHPPPQARAEFRFYAELNDFLWSDERQVAFLHSFEGTPSIKDTIEGADGNRARFAIRLCAVGLMRTPIPIGFPKP